MNGQWDTGWLIWMIILIALAAIAWLVAIGAGFAYWRTKGDAGGGTTFGAVVAALVIGIIGTLVAFPFSGQYHRYVPQTGTVAKIGSRLIGSDVSGGGTTQKFVVTYANGRSYGCNDTRCSNVAIGDRLTLMCERSFQFNAPYPGWDCNWGIDHKPNGQIIP